MNLSKIKKSGFSIAITLIFLTALILLNVLVGMLTERFFIKVDLTDTGIFTLSDSAAEFLSELDETVDIIVLAEESAWRANSRHDMISNILRNYAASSGGSLRVQYVNPDLNSFDGPKYNNSLSALKEAHMELEDMARDDIILLSSRRAAIVPARNLFTQTQDQMGRTAITGVRADQELISALIYVLNEQIARIVFISNHGESQLSHFTQIFERSGYMSSTINLATEEIPGDTTVLVTAAPQFDFLNDEIVKLEDFLSSGGNFIILYDPTLPSMPLFENFMAEWGVVIEDKLIFDEELTFVPQFGIIGAHVAEGELPSTANAEAITRNIMPLGVFQALPLRSDGAGGGFIRNPLVSTFSASSYAKDRTDGNLTTHERESGDASGPFTLAYHISRLTHNTEGNQVLSNLIIAGVAMFDDSFLRMYGDSFYNNILISDLANDLNPFGERVLIPQRELSDSTMLVSAGGTRTILIVMVIALPLAIIACGVIVWRKRRHL